MNCTEDTDRSFLQDVLGVQPRGNDPVDILNDNDIVLDNERWKQMIFNIYGIILRGNYRQEERTAQHVVPVQESSNHRSENNQVHNEIVNGSIPSNNSVNPRSPQSWSSHRSTNLLTGAVVPSTSVRSDQVPMRGLGIGQSIQFTSGAVNASGEAAASVNIDETKN